MAICKFCGAESGDTKFCQNCGAQMEVVAQPIQPQIQQPVLQQQPMGFPSQQPINAAQSNGYIPKSAAGLVAGNVILIVLGTLCCCCVFFTIISTVLGIIGVVNASKVRGCTSPEEEQHCRGIARLMMIIGYVLLVVIVVTVFSVITAKFGSISEGVDQIESWFESVAESIEEEADFALRLR